MPGAGLLLTRSRVRTLQRSGDERLTASRSCRLVLFRRLVHHVLRIPVGPVLVAPADLLLMLAMCRLGTTERSGQAGHRAIDRECRCRAAGQANGDFLDEPAVAVRVGEREP